MINERELFSGTILYNFDVFDESQDNVLLSRSKVARILTNMYMGAEYEIAEEIIDVLIEKNEKLKVKHDIFLNQQKNGLNSILKSINEIEADDKYDLVKLEFAKEAPKELKHPFEFDKLAYGHYRINGSDGKMPNFHEVFSHYNNEMKEKMINVGFSTKTPKIPHQSLRIAKNVELHQFRPQLLGATFETNGTRKFDFGMKSKLSVPFNATLKGEKEIVDYAIVLPFNIASNNYYHVLCETVFGLAFVHWFPENIPIIYQESKFDLVSFFAKKLGINAERLIPLKATDNKKIKKAILLHRVQGVGTTRWFEFFGKFTNQKSIPFRKVYVSRRKSARAMANEHELEKKLSENGFEIVYAEELKFDEQITLFSETKVLVSAHGAGLANIVFMKKGTYLVELFPDIMIRPEFYYRSRANDMLYDCVFADKKNYININEMLEKISYRVKDVITTPLEDMLPQNDRELFLGTALYDEKLFDTDGNICRFSLNASLQKSLANSKGIQKTQYIISKIEEVKDKLSFNIDGSINIYKSKLNAILEFVKAVEQNNNYRMINFERIENDHVDARVIKTPFSLKELDYSLYQLPLHNKSHIQNYFEKDFVSCDAVIRQKFKASGFNRNLRTYSEDYFRVVENAQIHAFRDEALTVSFVQDGIRKIDARLTSRLNIDFNAERIGDKKTIDAAIFLPLEMASGNYYHVLSEKVFGLRFIEQFPQNIPIYYREDKFNMVPFYAKKLGISLDRLFPIQILEDTIVKKAIFLHTKSYIWTRDQFDFFRQFADDQVKPFRKVYISRGKTKRSLENETELENKLKEQGFEIIYAEDLNFDEQIKLFSETEVLVSSHGAGLANILFMQKGTRLISIFREDLIYPEFYLGATINQMFFDFLIADGNNYIDIDKILKKINCKALKP